MKRIAIIGAGPMGLEAALYARKLGHRVALYERGRVGEHLGRWGHVTLFSPWRMNVSSLAASDLERAGWSRPDPDAFPTGKELRERYLLPLAESLGDVVLAPVEVLGVARKGPLKGEEIGGDRRAAWPFHLLIRKGGEELPAEADVVLDASGTFATPNSFGAGGLPAPGEAALGDAIERGLPDILGARREEYARSEVLLVGAGHSAATSLLALARLHAGASGARVFWSWRSGRPEPCAEVPGDPLPGRRSLAEEANRLARERPGWLAPLPGTTVESLGREGGRIRVRLSSPGGGGPRTVLADRVIGSVGYRPDLGLARELQAHFCYASEGAMRLAAKLLGGGGDCLRMPQVGPDAYRHPEPGFFTIGQKSYGRSGAFLLANGREGIRDVFRLIEDRPELDLYAGAGGGAG